MTKILAKIHRNERGITGLETAIIVIAFVVVASVFAYTVLSAGLFSSEKANETVHSGISQSQATSELRGSLLAYKGTANGDECITKISFAVGNVLVDGKAIDLTPPYYVQDNGTLKSPVLDNCDDVWSTGTPVTSTITIDSADYRSAPRSAKVVTTGTGMIACENLLATDEAGDTDLSIMNQIEMWVKVDAIQASGDLQLALYNGGTGTVAVQTMDLPALATNTWKKCVLTIDNPAATGMDSIDALAILADNDVAIGTTIHIDEVKSKFTESQPVTLLSYNDSNIVIPECAWTVEFSGGYEDDGDYLLEDAEKAVVTVWLQHYDASTGIWSNGSSELDPFIDDNADHLDANGMFSIQLMPSVGATLLMEKRIPAYLSPVMRLN